MSDVKLVLNIKKMRKIRKYGEEVLRKKSKEVEKIDTQLLKLIESMKKTLVYYKGLGLAACQVGVLKRVIVALDQKTKKIITAINPEIVETSGQDIDMEGCLSFPEIYFSIKRPKKATLKGINEKGKEFIYEGSGVLGRCFCHEVDHLNSILIIDYATEEEKNYWKEKIDKIKNK